MSDDSIKSAYELAMERLEASDREQGVTTKSLTDEQKKKIAELRAKGRAKLAELEILHGKNREGTAGDPEKLAEVEENYRIDCRRAESQTESAVARVKAAEGE